MLRPFQLKNIRLALVCFFILFIPFPQVVAGDYSLLRDELSGWVKSGKTKKEIALELEVDPSTMSKFLNGTIKKSPKILSNFKNKFPSKFDQPSRLPVPSLDCRQSTTLFERHQETSLRRNAANASVTSYSKPLPRIAGVKDKYDDGYDSEEEKDWNYRPEQYPRTNRMHDQALIPFFRGVHCFKNIFPDNQRARFLKDHQIEEGVYSTAAYDVLKLDFTETPKPEILKYNHFPEEMKKSIRAKALGIYDQKIKRQVKSLSRSEPIIVDGIRFKNSELGLYYLYVKCYTRFLEELKNGTLLPDDVLKEFIAAVNPIVSASEKPEHAILYAAGLKIPGQVLRPEFDSFGKPKYPYIGKVYTILIPHKDLEDMGLFRVLEAYAKNEMPVNCRIIYECEAGFAGGISGQYIVKEHVIRVPNFKHEWKKDHENKYGLTKRIYNNLRKKILATNGDISKQEQVYEELIHQIINRKYRQTPNDRTLANRLLDIARNEAWIRNGTMQFLDFKRLPTPKAPTIEDAKKQRHEIER